MKKTALIFFGLAAILPVLAFAQTQISVTIPGGSYVVNSSTPPGYVIGNFYDIALLIGGLAAFGSLVYGGIRYAASGGNPSAQQEAKGWIQSAFLGLALLICAYLILYTINPNLVNLSLPTLQAINIQGTQVPQSSGGGTVPGQTGCATGQCQTLPNCTQSSRVNCGGAPEMVAAMQCVQSKDPNFSVSEGYPPTGGHSSGCHNNGCCIDTTVPGGDCQAVNALIQAARQCGASVLNEYTNCGGTGYIHTTGGNVHIIAPHINGC